MPEPIDFYDDDEPMVCPDCGRPTYYDYGDDAYHHAVDAARGCFLLPPDQRSDRPDHPLYPHEEADV